MMKTKEYDEAIRYYTRSINIDEYDIKFYVNNIYGKFHDNKIIF